MKTLEILGIIFLVMISFICTHLSQFAWRSFDKGNGLAISVLVQIIGISCIIIVFVLIIEDKNDNK